jgi:acetate kinase
MADTILVVNAGSSSIKLSIFEIVEARTLRLVSRAQMDGIPIRPRLRAQDAQGVVLTEAKFSAEDVPDVSAALARVGGWLRERLGDSLPVAVGHRVVHGGPNYAAPLVVDDEVLAALERVVPLAPLHEPHNLAPMRAIRERFPSSLQVACFDTAFHRTHAEVADRYALPEPLYREGVRRYGFHGLSYEYVAQALPRVAPEIARGRVVVAHLGNGASMCAIQDGRSVHSTMGFTALDGLPMGTRCGQLDPGVMLYLLAEKGYRVPDFERLLYHESGLYGLSGVSSDVRDLLASGSPGARLALDYFVYRCGMEIGALAGAMGGIDALVFTAGIGENSPEMRARICARAEWLGMRLDDAANRGGAPRISTRDSRVSAWVIPTNEELMIATHTLDIWHKRKEDS